MMMTMIRPPFLQPHWIDANMPNQPLVSSNNGKWPSPVLCDDNNDTIPSNKTGLDYLIPNSSLMVDTSRQLSHVRPFQTVKCYKSSQRN